MGSFRSWRISFTLQTILLSAPFLFFLFFLFFSFFSTTFPYISKKKGKMKKMKRKRSVLFCKRKGSPRGPFNLVLRSLGMRTLGHPKTELVPLWKLVAWRHPIGGEVSGYNPNLLCTGSAARWMQRVMWTVTNTIHPRLPRSHRLWASDIPSIKSIGYVP